MSRLRTVQEYFEQVKHQVSASGCSTDWTAVRFHRRSKTSGWVEAEELRFPDDATLRFIEEVVINRDGTVDRIAYSFNYDRPEGETWSGAEGTPSHGNICCSFRYDRDPARARPIVHEECHLHVNDLRDTRGEELRFRTHATTFEEVFEFIRCVFYS